VAVRKRELPDWRALVGGAAVFLLVLMFLDFPYRLIAWDPRKAQEVKWHGAECYILGERQIDVLLFCPQLPPPRNNIVRKNDPTLEETPYVKDMFEHVPVR
jgi:hypothetical protein